MSEAAAEERLKETALADLHRELGARMVPFAGYSMPVQYVGILAEHRHTRSAAGLFDVSHMGQARLSAPDYASAAAAIEQVTPGDFASLKPGRMRYSMLLTPEGTIVDDIMVARLPGEAGESGLNIVFNAARVAVDTGFVGRGLAAGLTLELPDNRAMLALQGPKAVDALSRHAAVAELAFMDVAPARFDGIDCVISRSGYTGEDGFEIYLAAGDAEAVARALLAEPEVMPIGLGARDSLRLEAGLPLYGHDIDETTTPVEADLAFAIGKQRRLAGDFPGVGRILDELVDAPVRRRVGIAIGGKLPAREGAGIFAPDGAPVGVVTSGGFGPTVGAPIAMGYVTSDFASRGQPVAIEVRGRMLTAIVAALPFVPHRYYRRGSKT
jgi:aminomethyltransferase